MYGPRPPRRIPAIDGRSVTETALLAIGVSALFVATTLLALVALAAAHGRPVPDGTAVAVLGATAILAGVVGARRLGGRIAADRDRPSTDVG